MRLASSFFKPAAYMPIITIYGKNVPAVFVIFELSLLIVAPPTTAS